MVVRVTHRSSCFGCCRHIRHKCVNQPLYSRQPQQYLFAKSLHMKLIANITMFPHFTLKMECVYAFVCTKCNHKAPSLKAFFRHFGRWHSHEGDWLCGLEGCAKTFRLYSSFKKHVNRHHQHCFDSCAPRSAPEEQGTLTPKGFSALTAPQDDSCVGSGIADDMPGTSEIGLEAVTRGPAETLSLLLLK